jgi:hypothetical protein
VIESDFSCKKTSHVSANTLKFKNRKTEIEIQNQEFLKQEKPEANKLLHFFHIDPK